MISLNIEFLHYRVKVKTDYLKIWILSLIWLSTFQTFRASHPEKKINRFYYLFINWTPLIFSFFFPALTKPGKLSNGSNRAAGLVRGSSSLSAPVWAKPNGMPNGKLPGRTLTHTSLQPHCCRFKGEKQSHQSSCCVGSFHISLRDAKEWTFGRLIFSEVTAKMQKHVTNWKEPKIYILLFLNISFLL